MRSAFFWLLLNGNYNLYVEIVAYVIPFIIYLEPHSSHLGG